MHAIDKRLVIDIRRSVSTRKVVPDWISFLERLLADDITDITPHIFWEGKGFRKFLDLLQRLQEESENDLRYSRVSKTAANKILGKTGPQALAQARAGFEEYPSRTELTVVCLVGVWAKRYEFERHEVMHLSLEDKKKWDVTLVRSVASEIGPTFCLHNDEGTAFSETIVDIWNTATERARAVLNSQQRAA
jgi:hypothetical protein